MTSKQGWLTVKDLKTFIAEAEAHGGVGCLDAYGLDILSMDPSYDNEVFDGPNVKLIECDKVEGPNEVFYDVVSFISDPHGSLAPKPKPG